MDFAQPYLATINQLDSVWLPPPPEWAGIWASGIDVRYLLSFGPFDVEPGQTLPISLAYVCGDNFHTDPDNFGNLPDNPDAWFENVNFDTLGINSTWADWVYDNPGVDTDSDGYWGEFTVCNLTDDSTIDSCIVDTVVITEFDTAFDSTCYITYELADTVWRKGDGVPDFRGATPPPAPSTYSYDGRRGMRVEPIDGGVRVLWNGARTETTRDVFSRELDFEGYRVWIARDDRVSSYSVASSYDIEDFNRWEWSEVSGFTLEQSPFTLEQLRCRYGSSCDDENWHPSQFTRVRPLIVPGAPGESDSVFYFEPQDFNRSILGNDPVGATTEIKKVYPDAPRPPVFDPDSIRILFPDVADSLYLTDEGFIKHFEYEYTFTNLLPTVPYWINVTAFDYGSPQSGLAALETTPTLLPLVTYASPTWEHVAATGQEVYVYPNPYRMDEEYREHGFEDRERTQLPEDKTRNVHFANLPPKCVIRIFSLDGDLVREIDHNLDPADPLANHDSWNLITRNTQLAVSGLYYWTVEDDSGRTQIGKLVLIM
jgi:hypothetical protein